LGYAALPECPSIALIEIAKAIEALLQGFGTLSLLIPDGRAGNEPAPPEVRKGVVRPAWPPEAAAVLAIGVRLHTGDLGVDFAARPLAFDARARIAPLESELLCSRVLGEGESGEGRQNESSWGGFRHVRYSMLRALSPVGEVS
jgi:hypothetical protein